MPILMPGTTRLWPLSAPLRAEMPLEQPQKERSSDAEPQAAQPEGPSDGPFYLRHHPFLPAGCAGGGVPAADLCRPRHPAWPPAEPERRGYPCHAGGQPQPVSSVHPPRCTGADQPFRCHQWPDPAASGRGRDQPEHAGQQQRRGLSPAGSRRAGAHQHPAHQVGDRRVPYPEHP